MEITDDLIDRLSDLSKLYFSENEKASIRSDLEKMIGFVCKLEDLNTESVKPLLHMGDSINRLREDVTEGTLSRETVMAVSPENDGTFFLVPRVVKKNG